MRGALWLLGALGCSSTSDPELTERAALGARMALLEARAELQAASIARLEAELSDARVLAVLGGPRRRYNGGVECDGTAYLPDSDGARASRALRASGLCETPGLVASK